MFSAYPVEKGPFFSSLEQEVISHCVQKLNFNILILGLAQLLVFIPIRILMVY